MRFNLKALFVFTMLACEAIVFPSLAIPLLVVIVLSGLAVSWLIPIKPEVEPDESQPPKSTH